MVWSKFLSRKFLVTLITLLLVMFGKETASADVGELQLAVAGLVGAVFVAFEAVLDRAGLKAKADAASWEPKP